MTTFFIETLKRLSRHQDQAVKRNAYGLLKRLQELTPQDYD